MCSVRQRPIPSAPNSRARAASSAVSTKRIRPSGLSITVSMESRVVPGASCTTARSSPTSTSIAKRIPWLVANLFTAFLAATVVSQFEGSIQRFALLAVFMPIVPLLGGNAGNQTLTVMVRGIALGELSWANSRKALVKEVLVGAVNGIVIGILVGLVAYFWKGNPWLGAVLALAMVGTLLVAAIMGTLIPLFLRWLKVDPALASSVFVTTATDVSGFLLFLGLGTAFLARFQ